MKCEGRDVNVDHVERRASRRSREKPNLSRQAAATAMYYTANFTLVTRRNLISSVINTFSCSAVNVADVAILYLQTWTVYFPKAVRLALNVCPCRPDNASSSPPTRASPCQILVKPSVRVSFLLQRPGRALQCVSYTLLDFPSLPMLAICSVPFADAALPSFLPS